MRRIVRQYVCVRVYGFLRFAVCSTSPVVGEAAALKPSAKVPTGISTRYSSSTFFVVWRFPVFVVVSYTVNIYVLLFLFVQVVDRWLSVRLELLGNFVVLSATLLSVLAASNGRLIAGLAGLSITNALR